MKVVAHQIYNNFYIRDRGFYVYNVIYNTTGRATGVPIFGVGTTTLLLHGFTCC